MDASYLFAKNAVATKFENLSPATVAITRNQILDTIGTALGGSAGIGIAPFVELTKEWGGKPESTIISYGGKVPAPHAAQVNATMAHALDYDDDHNQGRIHCSAPVVPTAMAIAERQGNVTGKDFITAVALGVDVACRMGQSTILAKPHMIQGGWHFSTLYGYFSSAVTAGKLIGLNEDQMVNAIGIVSHQAGGNLQCLQDGAMTKRMGPGFAARGGIMSALMAEKGLTGSKNSLEGERGIYNLYHAGLDRDKLLGKLGEVFEGVNVSFKPYPCCRLNHSYVHLTLQIIKENGIVPSEVEGLTLTVHQHTLELLCTPLEVKRMPRNVIDCQFSLPWSVACAVVRGRVGPGEFTESSLRDKAIIDMASKVTPVLDRSLTDSQTPGTVNIKTKRGEFSKTEEALLGSPRNPLTMEAIIEKFRGCASMAAHSLSDQTIDEIISAVTGLDKSKDVGSLFKLLGAKPA